jgi:hypothetical protein
MASRAAGEAERRRRARARKEQLAPPVTAAWPYGWEPPLDTFCPDPTNHKVCPKSGDGHDWYKPHPRPKDHKYECLQCRHYDLDDYM